MKRKVAETKPFEIRFYEFLGVRLFRALAMKLERLLHRRDKGSNINYHLGALDPAALDGFTKFLFYNGVIHARNIIYAAVYFLLRLIFGNALGWFDILVILLTVKDIYCVMLQRYNFLRIRQRQVRLETIRQKKIAQKARRIAAVGLKDYDRSKQEEDLALIRKLRTCIENKETIVLSNEDGEILKRLGALNNTQKRVDMDE